MTGFARCTTRQQNCTIGLTRHAFVHCVSKPVTGVIMLSHLRKNMKQWQLMMKLRKGREPVCRSSLTWSAPFRESAPSFVDEIEERFSATKQKAGGFFTELKMEVVELESKSSQPKQQTLSEDLFILSQQGSLTMRCRWKEKCRVFRGAGESFW